MYNFEFGSRTAKGGFTNEKTICKKFNNWRKDNEAMVWLEIMVIILKKQRMSIRKRGLTKK